MASLSAHNRLLRWLCARPLALLCLIYVALCGYYNAAMPLFENPDEHGHYQYVLSLAAGDGLPVLPRLRNEADPWRYHEGGQGPLYYAVAAVPVALAGAAPMEPLLYRNPYFHLYDALDPTNKNLFIHTDAEAFPWRGAALGVHLARAVSTGFGLLAVLGAYGLAREVISFPSPPASSPTGGRGGKSPVKMRSGPDLRSSEGETRQRRLALLAAALVAFNPAFVAASAAVSNDAAATGLSAAAVWLMARALNGVGTTRRLLALGMVSGLAVLAKTSALPALPMALLVVAAAWARHRLPVKGWGAAALILVPAAAISGWWFARNQALYGELTGTSALMQTLGYPGVPYRTEFLINPAVFIEEFRGLRYSFWGMFGWFKILLPLPYLHALDVLSVLALVGIIALIFRQWRARGWDELLRLGLPVAWTGAVFAGVTLYNLYLDAYHGRLMFPAISAIAALMALGLDQVAGVVRARPAMGLLPVGLAFVAVIAPSVYLRPALLPPPAIDPAAIPASAARVDWRYGEGIRLAAAEVAEEPSGPERGVSVALYWEALAAMDADYTLDLQVLGQDYQPVGIISTYPGGGTWPTSRWRPGDAARDCCYAIKIDATAARPAVGWVVARFIHAEAGPLPVYDASGAPLDGLPIVGWTRLRPGDAPPPAHPLDARFDNGVRLTGYDLARVDDGALEVALHWAVDAPVGDDLTVFVHALDEAGAFLGQGDGPPVNGFYPTWAWAVGDQIVDRHRVDLDASAEVHEFAVGLYRLSDGARIPVQVNGASAPNDIVSIPAGDDDPEISY
mgnify:FL=1